MELTLIEFVRLALAGSLTLVLLSALISRFFHARSKRQAMARRVICRLCLHAFEDSSHGSTVVCPACGATTARGRHRSLG
ncbi:MAG: hypothetical protein DVB25_00125 [Verrucomicrobia bacterium]|nr:MAG: hypothetical protein DVB25_00125 [Verrucomicrobiota bacterium]